MAILMRASNGLDEQSGHFSQVLDYVGGKAFE